MNRLLLVYKVGVWKDEHTNIHTHTRFSENNLSKPPTAGQNVSGLIFSPFSLYLSSIEHTIFYFNVCKLFTAGDCVPSNLASSASH